MISSKQATMESSSSGGGRGGSDPSPMIELNRRPSSLTRARIEGMDQLEKSVMDDGSSNDNLYHGSNYATMTDAEKNMKDEELSFYSASDNDCGDDNIWGLLSGIGGNIYEWYVFFITMIIITFTFTFIAFLSFTREGTQTDMNLFSIYFELL